MSPSISYVFLILISLQLSTCSKDSAPPPVPPPSRVSGEYINRRFPLHNLKDEIPEGVVVYELRLGLSRELLKIHGLWAGVLESMVENSVEVMYIKHIRNMDRKIIPLRRQKAKEVIEGFDAEYKTHLERIWFGHIPNPDFWIHEFQKHSSVSTSSYFEDYIQRTEQLASTYLEGGQDDIINTLISLGYTFGEFYEACQVSDDLKKELGANVFLIFEVVNGEICLVEIGIALDIALDSTSKLIDHPVACPDGLFKLCALEFKDRHPQVTWSQTEDEIFIDVNLNVFDDFDNLEVKSDVDPGNSVLRFSANATPDIHYDMELELFDEIKGNEIKSGQCSFSYVLEKGESKWWDKLLKGNARTLYHVKGVEPAPADACMVGMGRMPGMEGMGGMPSMGDFCTGDDKVQEATKLGGEDNEKVGEETKVEEATKLGGEDNEKDLYGLYLKFFTSKRADQYQILLCSIFMGCKKLTTLVLV